MENVNNRIKLPSAEQVLAQLPLHPELAEKVAVNQRAIKDILEGKSDRKIIIAGPCSAWPKEAAIECAEKYAPIADAVKDRILLVMRGYIQKPRTIAGWPGPLVQPDPYSPPDIRKGIYYCRKMILDIIEKGLPVADEMLFTHNAGYFDDLLSYLAVGARSAEDSEHRYLASSLEIPVGIKNPTSGNSTIGVNSLRAAQSSHTFAHNGEQITSKGNPYAHLILRGGDQGPNYSTEEMVNAITIMLGKVKNPSVIVDVSHDNCKVPGTNHKDHNRQPGIMRSTLSSRNESELVANHLKGWMVESFLVSGNQDIGKVTAEALVYGKSITDPCIDMNTFEDMVYDTYERLGK